MHRRVGLLEEELRIAALLFLIVHMEHSDCSHWVGENILVQSMIKLFFPINLIYIITEREIPDNRLPLTPVRYALQSLTL
jgi:hypothetical protein